MEDITEDILQYLDDPGAIFLVLAVCPSLMPYPTSPSPMAVPVVNQVIDALTRLGIINFGVFRPAPPRKTPVGPRVVVVGAGMSGLGAARHLTQLGFRVTVVEAKVGWLNVGPKMFFASYELRMAGCRTEWAAASTLYAGRLVRLMLAPWSLLA